MNLLMANAIVSGRPFLGKFKTVKVPVILLDLENSEISIAIIKDRYNLSDQIKYLNHSFSYQDKTLIDVINSENDLKKLEENLFKFIPKDHHASLRARTNTNGMHTYFQKASDAGRRFASARLPWSPTSWRQHSPE